jgi:hypothetical protein
VPPRPSNAIQYVAPDWTVVAGIATVFHELDLGDDSEPDAISVPGLPL